ncbi:hypothetical protein C0992_001171 [Termitomyces sp. T32_za158]|nr:hypothetical protein C0992_001171 [Termitomyces sp. T32_za158]
MRWAIASTGSALHPWRVDADGFGTFIKLESGVKLWYIAKPKSRSFEDSTKLDTVMNGSGTRNLNEELWEVELVVLEAGDIL